MFSVFSSSRVISTFLFLVFLWFVAKSILIAYRIVSGEWPPSVRYLAGIIQWDREIAKALALLVLALVVAFILGK